MITSVRAILRASSVMPTKIPPYVPSYAMFDTCLECFEPTDSNPGWLSRFIHRHKWGHDPVPMRGKVDWHAAHVEQAKRYREYQEQRNAD